MKTSFLLTRRNIIPAATLQSLILATIACFETPASGAEAIVPDLKKLSQGIGAKIADTVIVRWDTDAKGEPALFARGSIWLEGVNFTEGTIECDILGKSMPRGSNFPGIAFHGAD